uniref:Uncharacterized protein n=1 Tax=Globodera pallida TaxID=36090 RepID=A0A183C6H5_GLOPA
MQAVQLNVLLVVQLNGNAQLLNVLQMVQSDPDQVQRNGNPNTIIDELPLEIVETILREHRNNLPSTSNVQEIQRQHRNNLPSTSNAASRGNGAWEPYEHLLNGTSELHFSEEQNIHRPNYNEQNNEDFGPAFSTRNEEWESHEHLLNGTSELHFSEEQNIHPPNYNGQNLTDLARDIGVTAVGGLARGRTAPTNENGQQTTQHPPHIITDETQTFTQNPWHIAPSRENEGGWESHEYLLNGNDQRNNGHDQTYYGGCFAN